MRAQDDKRMLAAARRLTVEATLVRVIQTLGAAGVRSLLLKGPSLAELYDGQRHFGDVDLLVAPEASAQAEAALGDVGFALRHDDTHSRIWRREGPDVDLHTTIVGAHVSPERLWAVLSRETELISVGEASIEALNRPARTLHVVLHAAQHGVEEAKPREDLRRALERLPSETWVEVARLAVELDAQAAFWTGLGMEPEGRALRETLQLGEGRRRTETELRASTAPPTAVGLLRLARTQGLRAKLGLVRRELFPSAAFLRTWFPLAGRGRAGLALAYLWRPVWMLLRLGPALAAIMRARRAARRATRG